MIQIYSLGQNFFFVQHDVPRVSDSFCPLQAVRRDVVNSVVGQLQRLILIDSLQSGIERNTTAWRCSGGTGLKHMIRENWKKHTLRLGDSSQNVLKSSHGKEGLGAAGRHGV